MVRRIATLAFSAFAIIGSAGVASAPAAAHWFHPGGPWLYPRPWFYPRPAFYVPPPPPPVYVPPRVVYVPGPTVYSYRYRVVHHYRHAAHRVVHHACSCHCCSS